MLSIPSSTSIAETANLEIQIRNHIMNNKVLWDRLALCTREEDLKVVLRSMLNSEYPDQDIESVFDSVAAEIIRLRRNPGTYLLGADGKALIRVTPDMIVTPPPTTREDGSIVAPKPLLHPKITSGLALAAHELSKVLALSEKYPNSNALLHLKKPESIIEKTVEIIQSLGGPKMEELDEEFKEETFIIGKENLNSVFQSFNPEFVRLNVFALALAKKIMDLNSRAYFIGSCDRKTNSLYSWYHVVVCYWT